MDWSVVIAVSIISFIIFFVVSMGMAIGVMFGRKPISGSCGGLGNKKDADGNTSCSLCQNPSDACKERRGRQASEAMR